MNPHTKQSYTLFSGTKSANDCSGVGVKDFSLLMLKELMIAIKEGDYQVVKFSDYWLRRREVDESGKVVLLRHDVDRFPKMALSVAEMEAELGILGTYFFRTRPAVFNPEIIKKIAEMGHEIGYHYECLSDARGDFKKAVELCQQALARLRELYPVVSAAMHSAALSKWDNRLFWNHCSLEELGIKGETYLSIDHQKYIYLADSGRNWNADRNVIWDKVEGTSPPKIAGTQGLIDAIKNGELQKMHLLIHPNRWPSSQIGWLGSWAMDMTINLAKKIIRQFHV